MKLLSAKIAAQGEGVFEAMFAIRRKSAFAVLVSVAAAALAAAADGSPGITIQDADRDRIAKLVEQLGSDKFTEREAASRDLERLGPSALEALRQVANVADAEKHRRAWALIQKIIKAEYSREFLQAKHVRLQFKDAALAEAVAELAKQSGYPVALADANGKLSDRKVTLDTGDVSFWQAVDLLCRAGNVVEDDEDGMLGFQWAIRNAAGEPELAGRTKPPAPADAKPIKARVTDRIVLIDGKPPTLPTVYVGAARIGAIRDSRYTAAKPARETETNIGLQFSLEPKLLWHRLMALNLRIEKPVDDQGQILALVTEPLAGTEASYHGKTSVQFVNSDRGVDLFAGTDAYTTLRLQKGEKPAKVLKELKGTLTAEVFGLVKSSITLDNPRKAAGKTFKTDDGATIDVLEVNGENGQVKLALDMQAEEAPDPGAGGFAPGNGVLTPGRPVIREHVEVTLVDERGKAIPATRPTVSYRDGETRRTRLHEFTFHLPKAQDKIKLVMISRRRGTIQVSFTLKDVPLP